MQSTGGKNMELSTQTEDNVTEVIYNWSIENFASLMNNNVGEGIVGERFLIDDTSWHFILHPNGSNPKSRQFISLWLFNDNPEDLSIEYQVFIGEHLLKTSGVNSVPPGQRHGILQLVSHIDILEKNLMDKSGHLNLSIKLMMEMDVEVIEASLEEDFVNAEINTLLETSLLESEIESPKRFIKLKRIKEFPIMKDPLKIEPSDHSDDELIQPKESASVINKPTPKIKSKSISPKPVSSNSNIDHPSSMDLPSTTIPLAIHKDNFRKSRSSNVRNPSKKSNSANVTFKDEVTPEPMNNIIGLTKQVPAEATTIEPVGDLIKIVLNLTLGDKVLFLKLLLLQLNNDMLSMVKKMVNTLVKEKNSPIDLTMRTTRDDLNYGEEIQNVYNDEPLDLPEVVEDRSAVEDPDIGTTDQNNYIDKPFNINEPLVKIHKDTIEEYQLEPNKVNLKKVDVRVKKLTVEMKEAKEEAKRLRRLRRRRIVAKADSKINEEVSNEDVQISSIGERREKHPEKLKTVGLNDAVDDIHKNENDGYQNDDILEEIKDIPNITIVKESIENYVPTYVDFDHPYALKVEKSLNEENELKYFCVKIVNHDQVFKTDGELRKHKKRRIDLETAVNRDFKKPLSDHGKSLIICDQCPQTFKTKEGWKSHERRHNEETEAVKNIQCDQCEMRFCSNYTLKSHILKEHSQVVCDKCGHTARNRYALKTHNITQHSDPSKPKPFQCDQCPSAFYLKSQLDKHMRIHNGGRPISCDQCNKTFHCKWQLNQHKASHGDIQKYKCKECSKAFKFSSTLYRHIKVHHTSHLPHECDICLKRFAVPYILSEHRRDHFPKANFSCDRCGGTFKQKQGLEKHLQKFCSAMFEGKKERVKVKKVKKPSEKTKRRQQEIVECDICGKSLRRRNLKNHLLSHSSEKPYSCEQCSQSFATKVTLRQHVKIHSKPFSCDQCQKSFSKTTDLKYHMRTHTGEKPYACDQCSKSFSLNCSLKKHKERYHNCNIEVTTSNDNIVEETVIASQDNIIEETDNMYLYQAIATIPM